MSVRKRLIAYVMCYVMALAVLPVSVAAETTGETGAEVSGGDTESTEGYTVKITIKKDHSEWSDSGYSYKLKKDGGTGENYITDLSKVPAGTYSIYEYKTGDSSGASEDTNVDVTVSGSSAVAEINYYTVTFDVGEGVSNSPSDQIVRHGSRVNNFQAPTKEGYSLEWKVGAGADEKSFDLENDTITDTTTIHAAWTQNTFTVEITVKKDHSEWSDSGYSYKLKKDGGTGENYITDLSKVPAGTYSIYEYKTGDSSGASEDTNVDVTVSGNSAAAEINYYTVTFDVGEGVSNSPSDQIVRHGSRVNNFQAPIKEGYSLEWKVGAGADEKSFDLENDTITDTTTIYAAWTQNTFTVEITVKKDHSEWSDSGYSYKLKKDGGTGENYITDLSKVPAGTYSIYEYKTGDSSGASEDTNVDVTVSGNSAAAEINYYTVTFDVGEGVSNSPSDQIVRHGSRVNNFQAPTKEGYSLEWKVGAGADEKSFDLENDTITDTTTIYAAWTQNTFTVEITVKKDHSEWSDSGYSYKLKKDGGTGENYITDLSKVPAGTYSIYEYKTGDSSGASEDTNVDVTVSGSSAAAEINYYTVTFYDGGKALTSPAPQTVLSGNMAEPPTEIPTKEGCTFAGWVKADGGNEKFVFETDKIEGTTQIYASWISIENVSYPTKFVYTGSAITAPSPSNFKTEIKTGVKFDFTWYTGWEEPNEINKIETRPSSVGQYILHVEVSADENYEGAKLNVQIEIKKATPAITSPTPEYKKIFGDSDFNLGFTNNNKDPLAETRYTVRDGSDVVSVSPNGTVKILKVGTAEIIASLSSTKNYEEAESNPVKITITCTHKGTPNTAIIDRTDTTEGFAIRKCSIPGCDHEIERFLLPQKTVEVELGGEPKSIISNSSKCTFDFADAKKYKKFFTFDDKTGYIKTKWKNTFNVKIPKDGIPIVVKTGGQSYPVNVKIKYPAPKINNIKVRSVGGGYYRFQFNYKGSVKKKIKPHHVKIRCKGMKINTKVFDRYLSRYDSTKKDSYIYLYLKKPKDLKFTITAYYGKGNKNASETTECMVKASKMKKK